MLSRVMLAHKEHKHNRSHRQSDSYKGVVGVLTWYAVPWGGLQYARSGARS